MKYKAIITTRAGEKIILDLSCREYHANKLNYVLSRTLDRSVYIDAAVCAVDAVEATAAPLRRQRSRMIQNEQKLIKGVTYEKK